MCWYPARCATSSSGQDWSSKTAALTNSKAFLANGGSSPSPLGKSADRRSEGRRFVVRDDPRFFAGLFVQSCFPVVSPFSGNVIGPVLGAGTSTLGHHRGSVSTPRPVRNRL
jgi:hypothetical protein